MGFIFQTPDNQFVMSIVEEEIAFGLEIRGIKRDEMHQIVDEMLTYFDIMDLKKRDISTLSGGQKQIVALASQAALNNKVIIFDEPTSYLDVKSTKTF
jgi:energy-coupling factor transporter ATP-binding protein EcfA2